VLIATGSTRSAWPGPALCPVVDTRRVDVPQAILEVWEPNAALGEVEEFLERSLLPGSRPTPATLRRRLDSDRAVVAARRAPTHGVVGVNVLYALTPGAVRAIEEKAVLRGAHLVDDHLARPGVGAAYYLSVIAADVGHRRAVVSGLMQLLASRRVTSLYSRPSTPEGHRFFERAGFVPIGAPSEIWRLTLPAGSSCPGQ
jgi:hypothetical protein